MVMKWSTSSSFHSLPFLQASMPVKQSCQWNCFKSGQILSYTGKIIKNKVQFSVFQCIKENRFINDFMAAILLQMVLLYLMESQNSCLTARTMRIIWQLMKSGMWRKTLNRLTRLRSMNWIQLFPKLARQKRPRHCQLLIPLNENIVSFLPSCSFLRHWKET